MTTLVVTGANGFVGAHVAEIATHRGATVIAVGREARPGIRLAPHIAQYHSADLEHAWPIPEAPDAIIHLAGLAAVGPSFDQPQRYLSTNSGIMTTMCESLVAQKASPRVVVVSTGAVYAPPVDGVPLVESAATAPSSPYAVAKLLIESQADYYATRGVDTVVVRPFNHIGPGQESGFIVPDIANALASLSDDAPLIVGNLAASRDYTDVRDVARAYVTLAFSGAHQHRVYNVASGESHTGFEIVEAVATAMGREVPELRVDARRLRPNDPQQILGDSHRLREEFGWHPHRDWSTSIADYITSR